MLDDYLSINARIKVLENGLLGKKEYDRLADSRTAEECAAVLTGAGWAECDPFDALSLENAADSRRARYFDLLERWSPSSAGMAVCRVPYDLHNFKALYKAKLTGADAYRLLSPQGRLTPEELESQPAFEKCVGLLRETSDPTLSDAEADRWAAGQMIECARGNSFLEQYAALYIDGCNFKLLRRARKAGKDESFFAPRSIPGGTVCSTNEADYPFKGEDEDRAVSEKLSEFSKQGRRDVFGDRCVPAFALAVENEIARVRQICALLKQGVPSAEIIERMGEINV